MRLDLDDFEDIERDRSFNYAPRKYRKKRKWGRFIGYLLISLIVVLAICYLTLKFLVGPIIRTVDGLPSGFPDELAIYELDKANISFQDPESRQKIISGMRAMPDWVLTLFLNALSDDLKSKLIDNFGDDINIDNNFNIDDLKAAFKSVDLHDAQTVSLSWEGVTKTKEEIAAYYKQKLSEANFEFKENLEDYQISLGFWKDGIFGVMSFSDADDNNESKYNKANVDMTVNYFDELK
jgi:hypothetical protein